MLKYKKQLLILTGIIAITLTARFVFKPRQDNSIPLAKVEHRENFPVMVEAEGQIRPLREHFLSVTKGGRLDRLLVEQGSQVAEGQVIGIVDETNRTAGLKSALSSYNLARSDFARMNNLFRSGAVPLQEMENAKSSFDVKRSDLEKAKQLMEDGLLRSPSKGVLTLVAFKIGDNVPDGSRVAIIEDHSEYAVTVKVPANYRDRLSNQSREVTLTELTNSGEKAPVKIMAEVGLSNPLSDFDGLNLDVTVRFKELPAGMSVRSKVRLSFAIESYPVADLVSNQALFWRQGKPYLMLQTSAKEWSWFEPALGIETKGIVTVLNLPKEAKVIQPGSPDQRKMIMAKAQDKSNIK